MEYIIYNDKKEIINESKDATKVCTSLCSDLFNKYILKSKDFKQVQYQYNYSDTQTITFIYKNNYRIIYKNIPTKIGSLDNYKMAFDIKNNK